MSHRHKRSRERGSTMVESALVVLVFLMVLIGIGDVAQVLFVHDMITERVRGAIREGVITYDVNAIKNTVLYGVASPGEGAVPSFNLTSSMVSVSRLDASTPEDRVVVTVSNYPVGFFMPFVAGRYTGKPIVFVQSMELGNLP